MVPQNRSDSSTQMLNIGPGFGTAFSPEDKDLYKCVQCGFCLPSCPTYLETGLETESPRGRIVLMKAVREGRLGMSDRVVSHWDRCLQCRACEVACPSGVPFGRLMEQTRSQVLQQGKESLSTRWTRRLFLRGLLPNLPVLRLAARVIRVYQMSGVRSLIKHAGSLKLLPYKLVEFENQQPTISKRFFSPSSKTFQSFKPTKRKVALLSGCIMPLVQASTMESDVNVLRHNHCDVTVPMKQVCCGALNLHSGDVHKALDMARRNIDIFLENDPDAIITASAGCGSTMKEYRELLSGDAAYTEKAARFSSLTRDITEFLDELPITPPSKSVIRRVTYQDACHLLNAQGISDAPRRILKAIPGVELVEMENSNRCCGAAGMYTVTQQSMSKQILESKMRCVRATKADVVVTTNPGCTIQLESGSTQMGANTTVCHLVDILSESYGSPD